MSEDNKYSEDTSDEVNKYSETDEYSSSEDDSSDSSDSGNDMLNNLMIEYAQLKKQTIEQQTQLQNKNTKLEKENKLLRTELEQRKDQILESANTMKSIIEDMKKLKDDNQTLLRQLEEARCSHAETITQLRIAEQRLNESGKGSQTLDEIEMTIKVKLDGNKPKEIVLIENRDAEKDDLKMKLQLTEKRAMTYHQDIVLLQKEHDHNKEMIKRSNDAIKELEKHKQQIRDFEENLTKLKRENELLKKRGNTGSPISFKSESTDESLLKSQCESLLNTLQTTTAIDELNDLIRYIELCLKEKIFNRLMFYPIQKKCISMLTYLFVPKGYTTDKSIEQLYLDDTKYIPFQNCIPNNLKNYNFILKQIFLFNQHFSKRTSRQILTVEDITTSSSPSNILQNSGRMNTMKRMRRGTDIGGHNHPSNFLHNHTNNNLNPSTLIPGQSKSHLNVTSLMDNSASPTQKETITEASKKADALLQSLTESKLNELNDLSKKTEDNSNNKIKMNNSLNSNTDIIKKMDRLSQSEKLSDLNNLNASLNQKGENVTHLRKCNGYIFVAKIMENDQTTIEYYDPMNTFAATKSTIMPNKICCVYTIDKMNIIGCDDGSVKLFNNELDEIPCSLTMTSKIIGIGKHNTKGTVWVLSERWEYGTFNILKKVIKFIDAIQIKHQATTTATCCVNTPKQIFIGTTSGMFVGDFPPTRGKKLTAIKEIQNDHIIQSCQLKGNIYFTIKDSESLTVMLKIGKITKVYIPPVVSMISFNNDIWTVCVDGTIRAIDNTSLIATTLYSAKSKNIIGGCFVFHQDLSSRKQHHLFACWMNGEINKIETPYFNHNFHVNDEDGVCNKCNGKMHKKQGLRCVYCSISYHDHCLEGTQEFKVCSRDISLQNKSKDMSPRPSKIPRKTTSTGVSKMKPGSPVLAQQANQSSKNAEQK